MLVLGGFSNTIYLGSGELFTPASENWAVIGSLSVARADFVVAEVSTNAVLVIGGTGQAGVLKDVEEYDVETGAAVTKTSMNVERRHHRAMVHAGGRRVSVAGGESVGGIARASVELYDLRTDQWFAAATMRTARIGYVALPLGEGRALLAAGWDGAGPLGSSEIYNRASGRWTNTADMATPRSEFTATLLQDGRVLVTCDNPAEIYDPATDTWSTTGAMAQERTRHRAVLLSDGRVLGGAKMVD